MVEFKINISDIKTGKTYKKEVKDDDVKHFIGKKIGDKINGEVLDLPGYEFEITWGSDYCGFPMRKDVTGMARKAILTTAGLGNKYKRAGMRVRRTVAGNTIYARTSQINLKILKHGKEPLEKKEEAAAKE